MKLIFKINPLYFIAHTLSSITNDRFSSIKYKKDIVNFQNYAWKESKNCYDLLAGRITFPERFTDKKIINEIGNVSLFLAKLQKSKEYQKIFKQTQEYLKLCQKRWEESYETTFKIMKELTGLKFNKSFIVYITHPSLKNGCYLGKNQIAWGHNEDWPNYSVIYLWHEILHSYFSNSELDHALISLATDEELRVRLNGGKYPPFISHKELFPLMRKILPFWREYLISKKKNLFGFRKKINKIIKI
ncbi:MAG: hypothetical protein ACPLKP_02855 [Microgenomates group bacterium]